MQAYVKQLYLLLHFHQRGEYRQHLIQSGFLQIFTHMLLHIAHYGLLALIQLPVVGTHLAGDHFEQSGFPGAVHSHHPYFVVCLYLKGHALKQEVRAESLCQIADAQKSHLYLPFPDIMPLILLIDRFSYRYLL